MTHSPGANQKELILMLKSLSRRVIANRRQHYPYQSNDWQEKMWPHLS